MAHAGWCFRFVGPTGSTGITRRDRRRSRIRQSSGACRRAEFWRIQLPPKIPAAPMPWIAFALLTFLAGRVLPADEVPNADDDTGNAEAFQKYAKETAAGYDIRLKSDGARKLALHDGSVLRWTNPVGGHRAHGEVFLWTDRGRPAAVLSLYQVTEANVVHEHHEFGSLALRGLAAARSGQSAWSPAMAGVELKPFPDASTPQSSPKLRLTQMRRLAGQLRADKTTREEVKRELRLLSNPVYRYESDDPEVLDGALFSFVEATDPEVFLMIEARKSGKDQHEWKYGLARMNSVRLRVLRGDVLLWDAPTLPWSDVFDRPDKSYTALRIR